VGETVAGLVRALGFEPRTVAIERNGAIVPRDRFTSVVLEPGDRLEIVRFVQGGTVADGELFEYSLRRVGR